MTKQKSRKDDAPEPVSAEETAQAIANRDAIARKFGHTTSGFMRHASPDCMGHTVTITKSVSK